jgi:RNA-directed DNA polymerase
MTKASIGLQDLRRKIYLKAKSDKTWRFWGLYVHVCKIEALQWAYRDVKANNGAPGIDGVTFADIEKAGVEVFLEQIQNELFTRTYRPMRNRIKEIPKDNGKVQILGIPTIRDRVVQGALKLVLEPIFEADLQEGSYGYRPKRTAHAAIDRVAAAVVKNKTRVIDLDLSSYFDNVRHNTLMKKVAERVNDDDVMRLLKLILKAGGSRGVPQGGLCKALHKPPYAKKSIMQSKPPTPIKPADCTSFTLHNILSYFNSDSHKSSALSSLQSGRLVSIRSG